MKLKQTGLVAGIIILIVIIFFIQKKSDFSLSVAPVTGESTFSCANDKSLFVTYADGQATVHLESGTYTLEEAVSGSGSRYANDKDAVVFWSKGNGAFVEENGVTTYDDCVDQNPDSDNEGGSQPLSKLMAGASAIYVSDQLPGTTVVVSAIQLDEPGFIIVSTTKLSEEGTVTPSGTSSILSRGGHSMVEITLSQPMTAGQQYFAGIATDNGDGVYSSENDPWATFMEEPVVGEFGVDPNADDPRDIKVAF